MKRKEFNDKEYLLFEANLLKTIASVRKDDPYTLSLLSETLCRLDRHDEALEIDKRLVDRFPEDPIFRYNLSCSYAMMGSFDKAILELDNAFKFGFDDIEYVFKDKDLKQLIANCKGKVVSIINKYRKKA